MVAKAVAMDSCDERSSSTTEHAPPCSRIAPARPAALDAVREVSTTKQPSFANFCAMAPPTPQRAPTGISLSSSVLPCASSVLRPSDCHLEVAPMTTATGLPCVLRASLMRNGSFLVSSWGSVDSGPAIPAPPGAQGVTHDQALVVFVQPLQFLGEHRRALAPRAGHLGDVGA